MKKGDVKYLKQKINSIGSLSTFIHNKKGYLNSCFVDSGYI